MPGTPKYPKDQGTEWMNLKTAVKGAFTSANSRKAFAKIGAGILSVFESIQVQAGAFISFRFANNTLGLFMGRHTSGGDPVDGIYIRRSDGTVAFWIYSRVDNGFGFSAMYDQEENVIFSDDGVAGKGIARPWLAHTWADTVELANPPATRIVAGTTDVAIQSTYTPVQHPKMSLDGYVYTAGVATVEIKVKDLTAGTTLFAATQASGYLHGEFSIPGGFGDYHQLDITARRASGAGNVGFTTLALMGMQS